MTPFGSDEVVEALLQATTLRRTDATPRVSAASIGARTAVVYLDEGEQIEATVYESAGGDDALEVAAHLREAVGVPDSWGLPAVGTNGELVFSVRRITTTDDVAGAFEALGVASALGGQEDC